MVYPYNRVVFVCENEWNTDACYNMGGPWKHYAKWKKGGETAHWGNLEIPPFSSFFPSSDPSQKACAGKLWLIHFHFCKPQVPNFASAPLGELGTLDWVMCLPVLHVQVDWTRNENLVQGKHHNLGRSNQVLQIPRPWVLQELNPFIQRSFRADKKLIFKVGSEVVIE